MEVIVFTNGCFDILHPGHLDLLERAKKMGTRLIVGINSDESVRAIKGDSRPFNSERDRMTNLLGLKWVDEVVIFNEPTPQNLIEKIKPDVLVKGGDWPVEEIIGSDVVITNGGRVFSLPLKEGYSSSAIAKRIASDKGLEVEFSQPVAGSIDSGLREHLDVFTKLLSDQLNSIQKCGELIVERIEKGNKILICGNGGSAGDAQHIATELVGRYEKERRGLPAVALTTDTSALTAIGNDYGFERIFSRQIEALGNKGDVVIAISTSGNSPNIISAVMSARKVGCYVIGLTGSNGRKLASLSDAAVMVPSGRTARIQEAHIAIGHLWCEMVESKF